MTSDPVQTARLLDQLEDPFTMFPVDSVSDILYNAVDESETRKSERMGHWGVARKFWSVEEEHYHHETGLLVGTLFVLGQAAITQTISILKKLAEHPRAAHAIPKDREKKMEAYASRESRSSLSKIVIINAVSNYFKHVYEWPERWDDGSRNKTIRIVCQLGMKPGELTDNLLHAADRLGLRRSNPRALADSIQGWRQAWARVLYPAFGLLDPNKDLV